MPEVLLSPRQVGERLALKRTATYELLSSGALKVIRHNRRRLRVREADLDEWIRAGCPVTTEQSSTSTGGAR